MYNFANKLQYIHKDNNKRIIFALLNPDYLSSLFHKELHMTFSNYLKQQRIIAAQNMLRHSDYDYSEIASFLAFSSQSHFTKVFRQETGYTPKEYRNTFFQQDYM